MADLSEIILVLKEGGVVAIPTDTVYGLACDMKNESAVQKIYVLKGRPANKALPIFIKDIDDLAFYAKEISPKALELAQKYWSGPLTVGVNKTSQVPDFVTAGGATVAIRIPNHPEVLGLLREYGSPLAVTSANRSEEKELTTSDAVRGIFGDMVAIMGGVCGAVGVSTILDTTTQPMRIIRQGTLNLPELSL